MQWLITGETVYCSLKFLANIQSEIKVGPTISLFLLDVLVDKVGEPIPVDRWKFKGKLIKSVDSDSSCEVLPILPILEEDS